MSATGWIRDGFAAGAVAATLSGIPSTAHGLLLGRPLEPTLAAGSLLLPDEERPEVLIAAAVPVHLFTSFFWAMVLSRTLPNRKTVIAGVIAGAAIAFIDLGVVGRSNSKISQLPLGPQVADHLAFGAIAAAVIERRRRSRSGRRLSLIRS